MNLTEKVILVTGGASGIGASCVEEFLKNDVKGVVIADINDSEIAKKFNEKYGDDKVTFIQTDVADRDSFERAFQKTVDTYDNVDILINCAGILDEFNYERTLRVNLLGTVFGCDLAINKYFPKYKSGFRTSIVNIASVSGIIPHGCGPHYSASKHGIVGLTGSYGQTKEIAKEGVCIMALCPGVTQTPIVGSARTLNFLDADQMEGLLRSLPIQQVEAVSRSVVEILQNAESGSIWVIDDGVLFKFDLPTYETVDTLRESRRRSLR